MNTPNPNLKLVYTLLCDDVRLEMGNKLSLMGVFQNIMVERLPVSLIKFAIVQHWVGEGSYATEVRIMSPDKLNIVAASQPSQIILQREGFADNISFFINTVLPQPGTYYIQTLVNSSLYNEFPLVVSELRNVPPQTQEGDDFPEIIN
jgi:hypothetical protein